MADGYELDPPNKHSSLEPALTIEPEATAAAVVMVSTLLLLLAIIVVAVIVVLVGVFKQVDFAVTVDVKVVAVIVQVVTVAVALGTAGITNDCCREEQVANNDCGFKDICFLSDFCFVLLDDA